MGTSAEEVRKMGYLKKLKTLKKKFFVLRESGPSGPARLEYYDQEKKFKAKAEPKRSIVLKTCFSISKKSDAKHKYALVLYTKDDCFSMACSSEEEQKLWLDAMLEIRNEEQPKDETVQPLFEHMWQVTMMNRGLANGKVINHGPYRICLTNMSLSLIRPSHTDPDIVFQFESIRRCGRGDNFFFVEVGRCSSTGAGELWMQVEDAVIAQNIYEAVHGSLETSRKEQPAQPSRKEQPRTRSHSSASEKLKPRPQYSQLNSSTLPKRSQSISINTGNDSPKWLRHSPVRSHSRGSTGLSGYSPITSSPISQTTLDEAHRKRTDSMDSNNYCSSLDEGDVSPHVPHSSRSGSASSLNQENPSQDSDYLPMQPFLGVTTSPVGSDLVDEGSAANPDGYVPMVPVCLYDQNDGSVDSDSYMKMNPSPAVSLSGASSYFDMSNNGSYSASPVSTSSLDIQEHLYYEMNKSSQLPPVDERFDGQGYLDMAPGQMSPAILPKPDKVMSHISDSSSVDEFPKRTYSVGSKPTQSSRIEEGYLDMTGGQLSNSTPNMAENLEERSQGHPPHTGGASSAGKRGEQRLMEFDFQRRSMEAFRARTSSGSKEMRPRTSSHSQSDMRQRASSFSTGMKNVSRHASMGKFDSQRPRTATICQDSIRPRTSSVGTTDSMRPRSSSYGNNRIKKTGPRGISQTSSQENLRKTLLKTSQESLMQGNKDYFVMAPASSQGVVMDQDFTMYPGTSRSSPQPQGHIGMGIMTSPGQQGGTDYLDMTPPGHQLDFGMPPNQAMRPDSIMESGGYMAMDMTSGKFEPSEDIKPGGGLSPQPVSSFYAYAKKSPVSGQQKKESDSKNYMSMESPSFSPSSPKADTAAYMMMGTGTPKKQTSPVSHSSHTAGYSTGSLKRPKVTSPLAHQPPKPHPPSASPVQSNSSAGASEAIHNSDSGEYINLEYNVKVELLAVSPDAAASSTASAGKRTSKSPNRRRSSPSASVEASKSSSSSAEKKRAGENSDAYFSFAPGKGSGVQTVSKDSSSAALSSRLLHVSIPGSTDDEKRKRSKSPVMQTSPKLGSKSPDVAQDEYMNITYTAKGKDKDKSQTTVTPPAAAGTRLQPRQSGGDMSSVSSHSSNESKPKTAREGILAQDPFALLSPNTSGKPASQSASQSTAWSSEPKAQTKSVPVPSVDVSGAAGKTVLKPETATALISETESPYMELNLPPRKRDSDSSPGRTQSGRGSSSNLASLGGNMGSSGALDMSSSCAVSNRELNYASLDLGTAAGDDNNYSLPSATVVGLPDLTADQSPRSPACSQSGNRSSASDEADNLLYAEIDFIRSEVAQAPASDNSSTTSTAGSLRENRFSFESKKFS